MLVGFAAVFGVAALGLDLGTPLDMGPGMFPLAIAALVGAIGAATAIKAFVAPTQAPSSESADAHVDEVATALLEGTDAVPARPTRPQSFGAIPWRVAAAVTAAVLWFAFTIDGLGLLLAAFGTVVLASYARSGGRSWHGFAVAAALTAASWLIFVVGLRLRVPLIGDWIGG